MKHWKIRITAPHLEASLTILMFCRKYSEYYGFVKERSKEGKEHFHIYLGTDVSYNTFVRPIQKIGDLTHTKGNSLFSCKELVLEDGESFPISYLSYMLKDQPGYDFVGVSHNLPDHVVELAKQCTKEFAKTKVTVKNQLQYFSNLYQESDVHSQSLEQKVRYLYRLIVGWYIENDKVIRKFYVKSLIETILLKYDDSFYNRLEQNFISDIL